MTKEELEANGFHSFSAKIGILYIKEPFFGILNKDGSFDYRHRSNDLHSLGQVNTIKELHDVEKQYYINQKKKLQAKILLIDAIINSYE